MNSPTTMPEWEYAPAPERVDPGIADRHRLFIGGRFVASRGRKTFETIKGQFLLILRKDKEKR